MIRVSKEDKSTVLRKIYSGDIDAAALSSSNLIDEIILAMKTHGILDCVKAGLPDKRYHNTEIPFELVMALAVAAKMKIHTSLTDIPYALNDHRTICGLGYSLWDTDRDLAAGLMSEGAIRHLIGKYSSDELFLSYNNIVQDHIMRTLDIQANIHILDCTKLPVYEKNYNYEDVGLYRDDYEFIKGYKLSTLRGIVDDTGIIEEIRFGPVNEHDLTLSRDMLLTTPAFKPGDILINDRGFISRELINHLKLERGVDSYVPLKKNMDSYLATVLYANKKNQWIKHPSRNNQHIQLVENMGVHWQVQENDVDLNACVIKDGDFYAVIVTTDLTKTASQIVRTYELRPEIEEDYRQLKDFWKLNDFRSTKLRVIAFHILCVLLGYLFFQLYTMMPEGEHLAGRSLPVVLKKYEFSYKPFVVVYAGDIFGIFTLMEVMQLYADVDERAKYILLEVIEKL